VNLIQFSLTYRGYIEQEHPMKIDSRFRKPLLAVALATCAASAWAYTSSFVPDVTNERVATEDTLRKEQAANATEMGLAPNESIVIAEETTVAKPAPAPVATLASQPYSAPAITIEKPRLTVDQRIQADVMQVLATNPTLSGKIGVVSEDRVVTLTGYTTTSGQAWRAGRDAGSVQDVRHVVNQIRPRVGGISS
jgi:hypothetical protein